MKRLEYILPEIIESLKSAHGHDFFDLLTISLAKFIEADYTFIAKLNPQTNTSETISLVAKGQIVDNFEYSLVGTPCADVTSDSLCIYPDGICALYPDDQLLVDMKIEGYIGTPLRDSHNTIIGIVVALHEKKITNPDFVVTLFELFSGRITAELERTEREKDLKILTAALEEKVKLRTAELSTALENLNRFQDEIIEKEKMASLGNLVAGVAHEINTPLSVAILSGSVIAEDTQLLQKYAQEKSLTQSNLTETLHKISESVEALNFNLHRAAKLVESFKQVAVDRNTNDISTIYLNDWLHAIIASMMPVMKKNNIELSSIMPDATISIKTSSSKLSQVLFNLVMNAVHHGFYNYQGHATKKIVLKVEAQGETVKISVKDNGVGVPTNIRKNLFVPFFTTRRNQGNTGLGLSIIKNILTGTLQGNITMKSEVGKGTQFIITLPAELKVE